MKDAELLHVCDKLLTELQPAMLLITLGEKGMLLAPRGEKPIHIPTAPISNTKASNANFFFLINKKNSAIETIKYQNVS